MSAVFGILRFDAADLGPDMAILDRNLSRFGPDGSDVWQSGSLAIGRRVHRATEAGRPDPNIHETSASRYAVAADVFLSERDDLARQLGVADRAAGLSDSALVALALEAWNEAAFDRLYGDFAIAAWDKQETRLLLARDPLGSRPLFFHRSAQFLGFASMPVALQALPGVPRSSDHEQMVRFLRLLSPSPGRSMFEGIETIRPGHFAVAGVDGVVQTRYWKPDLSPLRLPHHADYVSALQRHLDDAVTAALRDAGPVVGAQMSSGFDSTAVATTAATILAPQGGRVIAYTAVPRDGFIAPESASSFGDEGVLAALTAARHDNMEHVRVPPDRPTLDNLDRSAALFGMPVLNLCNLTWFDAISDRVRAARLTVVLNGSRGNLTISESGVSALPELARAGRFGEWLTISRGLVRGGWMRWRGIFWNTVAPWLPLKVWKWGERIINRSGPAGIQYSGLKPGVWTEATKGIETEMATADPLDQIWYDEDERPAKSSLQARLQLLNVDLGAFNKGILAEWGYDYRDPTSNRRLVEFSLRVPVEHLIHQGRPRAMLRDVLADRVPAALLDNKKKGQQAVDWHEQLSAARLAVEAEIERIEMFDPTDALMDVSRLKQLLADWPEAGSARWLEEQTIADYRYGLLRSISVAAFMRKAAGSNY